MQGMNIARRRGTSVAAAALSLALIVPFAQPVVSPAAAPAAVAQEAQEAQASPTVNPESKIIDADMIASGRVTKDANLTDAHGVGKGLISGHVYLTGVAGNPGAAYDNGNVKLDGITVYAQFRDKDGSYSPIFSAKTHTLPDVVGGNGGQGTFAFGTGDTGITWTDKLGREHTYTARTDQMHRIWVEPFTNERGNRVEMFRQANGFVPGSFNLPADAPLGSFVASDGNMQLTAAFLREVAPNHKESWLAAKGDKLVEDPEGPIASASTQTKVPNTVSGRVWLETGGPDKGIVATGPAFNSIDEPADGYTVYASTLTKDGAAANQKLRETYKNDPNKIAQATKEMLEAHPEYILKTVYGKTNNKGEYTLRFGNYEKGQIREDILNPNHLFVWVEDKNGVVQNGYTGFHTPTFQRFNFGGNFRPAAIPGENQLPINYNGVPFQNLNSLYNVHYAIMPYAPASITADYNATDKPAAPGVTVTPELHGTVSSATSKVEWRDVNGKVLKTCDIDQSKSAKEQVAACTFDIPQDAKKGDYFNVVLVSGGNDVSAWTVLVTRDADEFDPAYEPKLVVPGKETKSSPTFTKTDDEGNPTEETVKAPEGTTFAIPEDFNAPDGYVVEINENTGEITVTFPDKSKLNKDTVEEFDVPVTVTYPDSSTDDATANFKLDTDGDGTPDLEDDDDDNDGIPDDKEIDDNTNPKVPNQNLEYEPEYTDGNGKPGDTVKIDEPTFTDKDGKNTKAPEGTTATGTPSEGSDDWTFTTDPKSGVVEAQSPSYEKVGEKIREELPKLPEIKSAEPGDRWKKFVEDFTPFVKPSVDVEFTYPGGSKDKATADFDLVGKDGKSLLDPDGDFDGDGASNKEEIEKGSNPADEKDVPDTTAPTVNPIKPGDKKVSGTDDRPNTEITVTFPGGKTVTTTTDENGNWSVDVPSDVDLKTGDKVTVTDGAGNSTEAKVGIDTGKCVATTLGFGLPLIALLPIGLATQMDIPGVTPIANEVSARLEQANSQIQQQLGIFNPQMAGQVAEINARLKEVGGDLSMVAAGIALIAAGILAGTLIYDNCSPNGGFNSSVKDLELKGSSGKTHKLSSKKQDEDKKSSAEK